MAFTKQGFVDKLKKRLGNNQDSTLDSDIVDEMDFVQEQILEKLPLEPHPLLVGESTLNTSASVATVSVPSGFIKEFHRGQLWVYKANADTEDDKWTALDKADIHGLRNRWPGEGEPKGYDLIDDNFVLFPTPDKAYTLKHYFYKSDTLPSSLTSGQTNEWLTIAGDLFLQEVGYIIADQYLQDDAMAARFDRNRVSARTRLHYHIVDRDESARDRFMGAD